MYVYMYIYFFLYSRLTDVSMKFTNEGFIICEPKNLSAVPNIITAKSLPQTDTSQQLYQEGTVPPGYVFTDGN